MDGKELMMIAILDQLAEHVRVYSARNRVSPAVLAKRAGVSPNTFSRISNLRVSNLELKVLVGVLKSIGLKIEFVEEKAVKEEKDE